MAAALHPLLAASLHCRWAALAAPSDTIETVVGAVMQRGPALTDTLARGRVGGDGVKPHAVVEVGVGNVVFVITAAQAIEVGRSLRMHWQEGRLPGLLAAAAKLAAAADEAMARFGEYSRGRSC